MPRLLLLRVVARVACVMVLAGAACERPPRVATGPFCYRIHERLGSSANGVNPLLAGVVMFQCFDDGKACERQRTERAKLESSEQCRAIGKPSWHCYSLANREPTSDPLNNASTCYPSAAICALSRPSAENSEIVVGACVAAETVYCYVESSGITRCYGDDVTCKITKDLVETVLVSGERTSDCAQRR